MLLRIEKFVRQAYILICDAYEVNNIHFTVLLSSVQFYENIFPKNRYREEEGAEKKHAEPERNNETNASI